MLKILWMKQFILVLISLAILISCSKDPIVYQLNLIQTEGGTVSPQSGSFEEGSFVTLTAIPSKEYEFTKWSNGSIQNPMMLTVTSNLTLQAVFTKKQYELTISKEGEGTVNEKIINTGKGYDSGTNVELTAVPDGEWVFAGWSGDFTSIDNPIQIMISSPKNIKATFIKRKYPLTINIEGQGTVTEEIINTGRTTEYDYGTTVRLTAQASEGWEFVGWTGAVVSEESEIQLLVTTSKTVSVVFNYNPPFVSRSPNYSLINQTTANATQDKLFPGIYITLERASQLNLNINQFNLINADYRFWDGNKAYIDYDNDGFLDMLALLVNFKDSPWGSNYGKYLLVNNVFSFSPEYFISDANYRFGSKMRSIDLNNDGQYEIIMGAEEDHELSDGSHASPKKSQIISISTSGDLSIAEFGEQISNHGQSFGDIDNDGDIDIISWRNSYTDISGVDVTPMPILYLNDGNNIFNQVNSFDHFKGLNNLLSFNGGNRKSYYGTSVELFDVDSDGALDIIFSYSHNSIPESWWYGHLSTRIYWGDGSAHFDFENNFTDLPINYLNELNINPNVGISSLGFAFFDYDLDGKTDVFTISTPNYGGFILQLCKNLGDRKFEDVTSTTFDEYYSIFPRNTQQQNKFPNFYELRIYDKDGDGDFDLVPDKVAIWGLWEFPITQDLYWENISGTFKINKN